MKYNRYTLGKLEELFKEQDYRIRYEKGTFQSGYCLVENTRVVVINKFFEVEARINTLLEILSIAEIVPARFSEKSAKFYKDLQKLKPDISEGKVE